MLDDLDDLNVPRFYALAALYRIGQDGIGRRRLADWLGLSESKTRTMLDHLRDAGLIGVDETLALTDEGWETVEDIPVRLGGIDDLDLAYLADDSRTTIALVAGTPADDEIAIRDEAVRGGATGLTLLRYDDGFGFPDAQDPDSEQYRTDLARLDDRFGDDASDGDTLLIVFAPEKDRARAGLWRALYALVS